jgi:two-component system chemotaxis sensor kinase CheA
MDFSEFKDKYIQDAAELLDCFENDLLELNKNNHNKDLIDNIYRYLHTIKGSGGMYGFIHIVEIAHLLEHIYKLIQDNKLNVTTPIINLSFSICAHLRNLLIDIDVTYISNKENHVKIVAQIDEILKSNGDFPMNSFSEFLYKEPEKRLSDFEIYFYPEDSIYNRNINLINVFKDLFLLGECNIKLEKNEKGEYWKIRLLTQSTKDQIEDALFFIIDYCQIVELNKESSTIIKQVDINTSNLDTENEKTYENITITQPETVQKSNRLQVDISRLNTLSFLVSELVTSKSALLTGIQENNQEIVNQAAEKIDKISRQFHSNVLTLRLVPLKNLTLQFKRLIHDLSLKLNKKIDFITQGDDNELDKGIIDEITMPIMHIIRNCIDHGIDTPEQRLANGKNETGIIKLFAYKSGNFVFIQISDDGKGIDTQKILQKAVEKGLTGNDVKLSEKEIFNLIFLPGLSTAETLSEISGRGIGMDIVKHKIQDLRGEIYIDSEKNLGSTFTIKLQQNISIIDTMLIQCGLSKFAIPVEDIENFEVGQSIDFSGTSTATFAYKNEVIPVVNLNLFLNLDNFTKNKTKLIIVNKYNKRFGIVVDRIIGEHQAVVKPLRKSFQHLSYYTGASALGDGTLAFLLDVNKIAQLSEIKQTN